MNTRKYSIIGYTIGVVAIRGFRMIEMLDHELESRHKKGCRCMPAIVGAINVNTVSGVFNIGDVGTIAPSSFNTTFAGGGSFNSGDTLNISNSPSVINIYGSDAYEQNFIVPEFDGSDQEDKET